MPHKNRQLSYNEVAALDVVNKHPGLRPDEIMQHIQNVQMAPSSISACMTRLIWLRKVNRMKVPGSSSYQYYPMNHPLPAGYTEWNNAITIVKRNRQPKTNGMPPKEAIDTLTRDLFNVTEDERIERILKQKGIEPPSDKVSLPNVLIVLPLAEKETITVTIEQARTIWTQLNAIFAK
jgi:hypothetical protein